tara:strand:+ start:822 stop:1019 length:198 start_codon:yes stop_codon:yes gene_type:complete
MYNKNGSLIVLDLPIKICLYKGGDSDDSLPCRIGRWLRKMPAVQSLSTQNRLGRSEKREGRTRTG